MPQASRVTALIPSVTYATCVVAFALLVAVIASTSPPMASARQEARDAELTADLAGQHPAPGRLAQLDKNLTIGFRDAQPGAPAWSASSSTTPPGSKEAEYHVATTATVVK